MDDVRVGRVLRALRRRRGLRQSDVGLASGVAQSTISLIERGHLATISLKRLRGVFAVVDASFEGQPSWRGGALDRLLDERHARLVGETADRLTDAGWLVEIEVTFSEYGERGSIDLLAISQAGTLALVVEVKTELTSIEETIRRLDLKARLAARIVGQRHGRRPMATARLLVLAEGSTTRRRVARHEAVLTSAFPVRGRAAWAWLRDPSGSFSGLLYLPVSTPRGTRRPPPRVWSPSRRNPRGSVDAAPAPGSPTSDGVDPW